MITTNKPLFALTAADLMSHPLVMIPGEMSLCGAAHLLSQAQVSGAPVVDENGRCIGVLSSTDFVHLMEKGGQGARQTSPEQAYRAWTILESDEVCEETVRDLMCADPVMVGPGVNIGELARMMVNVHIHRVIVVDDGHQPIGIVSSTDLLAALAHAYQTQEVGTEDLPTFGLPEPVSHSLEFWD